MEMTCFDKMVSLTISKNCWSTLNATFFSRGHTSNKQVTALSVKTKHPGISNSVNINIGLKVWIYLIKFYREEWEGNYRRRHLIKSGVEKSKQQGLDNKTFMTFHEAIDFVIKLSFLITFMDFIVSAILMAQWIQQSKDFYWSVLDHSAERVDFGQMMNWVTYKLTRDTGGTRDKNLNTVKLFFY